MRAESRALGLRVFVGARQAIVSTNDLAESALEPLAERAIAMARAVPEDPYAGLADPALLARDWPALDLADAGEPDAESLMARAAEAEDAARAVAGVTNSEGGGAGWRRSEATLATSDGFLGGYATSGFSVSAAVLAGEGTAMERDYDWSTAVHEADLEDAAAVGRRAGERAVKRLGARKARSGQVPVVYDPRIAGGLLSHLAGAIAGPAIARGTSFLKDALEPSCSPRGSPSSTTRTVCGACARAPTTARAWRRRGARSSPTACCEAGCWTAAPPVSSASPAPATPCAAPARRPGLRPPTSGSSPAKTAQRP